MAWQLSHRCLESLFPLYLSIWACDKMLSMKFKCNATDGLHKTFRINFMWIYIWETTERKKTQSKQFSWKWRFSLGQFQMNKHTHENVGNWHMCLLFLCETLNRWDIFSIKWLRLINIWAIFTQSKHASQRGKNHTTVYHRETHRARSEYKTKMMKKSAAATQSSCQNEKRINS